MSLLDALAESQEPATLKMLSQATGLHPSPAHRILAAMTGSRIVERHEAGSYRLGLRLRHPQLFYGPSSRHQAQGRIIHPRHDFLVQFGIRHLA